MVWVQHGNCACFSSPWHPGGARTVKGEPLVSLCHGLTLGHRQAPTRVSLTLPWHTWAAERGENKISEHLMREIRTRRLTSRAKQAQLLGCKVSVLLRESEEDNEK